MTDDDWGILRPLFKLMGAYKYTLIWFGWKYDRRSENDLYVAVSINFMYKII